MTTDQLLFRCVIPSVAPNELSKIRLNDSEAV